MQLLNALARYKPTLTQLLNTLARYKPTLTQLLNTLARYKPALTQLLNTLARYKPTLTQLLNTLARYKPALTQLLNTLARYKPTLTQLLNTLARYKPALTQLLNTLTKYKLPPARLLAAPAFCKLRFHICKNPRRKIEISCRDFFGFGERIHFPVSPNHIAFKYPLFLLCKCNTAYQPVLFTGSSVSRFDVKLGIHCDINQPGFIGIKNDIA